MAYLFRACGLLTPSFVATNAGYIGGILAAYAIGLYRDGTNPALLVVGMLAGSVAYYVGLESVRACRWLEGPRVVPKLWFLVTSKVDEYGHYGIYETSTEATRVCEQLNGCDPLAKYRVCLVQQDTGCS